MPLRFDDAGHLTRTRLRPARYPAYPDISSRRDRRTRSLQMLLRVRCLTVSNAGVALPNFYNIAIRIANVAARLAVFGLRLRDELGSSTSPKFITRLNICNADIHQAADEIGSRGDAELYRCFVGCRTAPGVNKEPRVRDLDVPRRAAAVASAQNATSEDRFVKSKRSLDVGDGEKVCDAKPILRRHLIAFLLDLDLVHRQLHPLARGSGGT